MNAIAPFHYEGSENSAENQADAVAALEDGRVVFLENLNFAFSQDEQALLGSSLGDGVQKNITLDPYLGKLSGTGDVGSDVKGLLEGMLERYRATTQEWLSNILGPYAANLEAQRTTYRPVEIAGRKKIGKVSSDKAYRFDDSLLHPDAFKRRPIKGNRIFRIFTNINPHGKPRTWKVGHGFEAFASRYLRDIREPRFGEFAFLNLTRQTHWPRTHYDHIMLNLHDRGKQDAEFQKSSDHALFEFPAGATWFCFTDQALHAALEGAYCLEQTYQLNV
ncbi:MAG: Kdo hydroxylase family protein, partial [Pseudomonadota bacterium]